MTAESTPQVASGVKAPQDHQNYRRRGPKKFGVTYQQISDLTGLSVKRLYRYYNEKGVNFGDLTMRVELVNNRSLNQFVMAARSLQRERTLRRMPV